MMMKDTDDNDDGDDDVDNDNNDYYLFPGQFTEAAFITYRNLHFTD